MQAARHAGVWTCLPCVVEHAYNSCTLFCHGVCRTLLGLEIDKSLQCSDWGSAELTVPQLTYAGLDAWLSLQLAQQLQPLLQGGDQQQQQAVAARKSSSSSSCWDLCIKLLPFVTSQEHAISRKAQRSVQQLQHSSNQSFQQGPRLPARPLQGMHQAAAAAQERQQQLREQQLQRQAAALVLQLQYQLPALQQQPQQQVFLVWHTAWKLLLLQRSLQNSRRRPKQQQKGESSAAFCQEQWPATHSVKLQQQQRAAGRAANGYSEGISDSLTQGRHLRPAHHQHDAVQQQPQQGGAAAAALAQQHRQQQLEQLQRLGLASHAPARSIYDRLHTLKPARLPTRKCLQVRMKGAILVYLLAPVWSFFCSGSAEQFQHNLLADVVVCSFLSEGPC